MHGSRPAPPIFMEAVLSRASELWRLVLVPVFIASSGAFMALAWLGHLRFKQNGFWFALAMSWGIVLPEYLLNVTATRLGHGIFSGAQMASIHLVSGALCVLLVSRFVLRESVSASQITGVALLACGLVLVLRRA
jgi:hypothetical protein